MRRFPASTSPPFVCIGFQNACGAERGVGAAPSLFNYGCDRDARVGRRRTADEQTVIGSCAGLRGTGLACHREGEPGHIAADPGRLGYGGAHTRHNLVPHGRVQWERGQQLRLCGVGVGPSREIPHPQEQMRGIPIPAVYQRGQVDAQLERGKCVIGLPDGGGDGVGCLPCNTVRFGSVIRTCQNAGCLAKLDACRLSEPEQRAVAVHLFNTQKPSRLIEKAVAGDADCLPPTPL